jgi:multidrug efflux pump subunit AcrA (membrane-fusion protein)
MSWAGKATGTEQMLGNCFQPRLLVCLTLALSPLWPTAKADPLTDSAAVAVTVVPATRTCFTEAIRVTGTLVAEDETSVRPDAEGFRISDVLADDGDRVSVGQVLARLSRAEGSPGSSASAALEAPVAGVVSRSTARLGALASPAGEPLFRIIAGDAFELDAVVPLARISKLAPGQQAQVHVAGGGDLTGRVRLVAPEIDVTTQMGQARITLGRNDKLRAGQFAHANIETGTSCNPSVPLSALLYGSSGAIVQVVRNGRVETRPVRVGLIAGDNTEIRSGLSEGDLVVMRAGSFLHEDDRVRPVQAAVTDKTTE